MQNIKKNVQSSWTQKMLALVVEYQIQLIQKLYKNVSAYSVFCSNLNLNNIVPMFKCIVLF